MTLTYTIKNAANPENPNEQPPGTEINDDRLFGHAVALVNTSGQSYTSDFFLKQEQSNKLVLSVPGMSFTHNTTVVITTA